MEAIYVTIILNLLLVISLLFGFLWGLGRGVKKSMLRLVFFIVGVVVAGLLSGVLTNKVLNIAFSFQGETATAREHIVAFITSSAELGELYNASPSLQLLITQIPAMFINIIMFLILLYIFKFISWIFYISLANVLIKKKSPLGSYGDTTYTIKKGQPVILTENPPKKHRLCGGLVGALQGFILLFLTLLPISGMISIFNNVTSSTFQMQVAESQLFYDNEFMNTLNCFQNSDSNSLNITENFSNYLDNSNHLNYLDYLNHLSNPSKNLALSSENFLIDESENSKNLGIETTWINEMNSLEIDLGNQENGTLPYLSNLIKDNINPQIFEYTNAYSNGIIYKFFNYIGLEQASFNSLTTITVANEAISLSNEVNTLVQVYTNFVTLYNDFDANSLENINFALAENTIQELFKSGIVRVIGNEVFNFYLQKEIENNDFGEYNSQVASLANIVEDNLLNNTADVLKQDMLASLNIFKIVLQNGIYDLIKDNENVEIDSVLELFTENDAMLFGDLINSISQSSTFQKLIIGTLNFSLNLAEDELYKFNYTSETQSSGEVQIAKLDRISYSRMNWDEFKNELISLFKNATNIYSIYKDFDDFSFEKLIENPYKTRTFLNNLAQILNTVQNSTALKNTLGGKNIFNQVLDELNNGQFSKYVNFSTLKNLKWKSEIQTIIKLFNLSINYNNGNSIDFITFDYDELERTLNEVFDLQIIESIKLKIFDMLLSELDLDELDNTNFNPNFLIHEIYNDFDNRFEYLSQTKAEFLQTLKILKTLGEVGLLNLFIYGIEPNWITLSENLNDVKTENGNTSTNAEILIDRLIELNAFRIAFVELFNNFVLVEIEDVNGDIGRLQKTVEWDGWDDFGNELKEITTCFLEILQNTDEEHAGNINSILSLSNLINSPDVSILNLGKILDVLATCQLLDYEIENITYSIYDQLIEKYFGEIFHINSALSENYTEDFWYNEFASMYEAFNIMNSIIIDEENQTSLLDAMISEEDFLQLILDAYENENLSDTELEIILNALFGSDLLKQYSVDLINQLNIYLINLIDETYNESIVSLDTDFSSQKQELTDIVIIVMKFNGKSFEDISNDIENDENEAKENFTNLMTILKNSYIHDGIFGGDDGAYIKITNYLTDENSENEFILAIVALINTEDEEVVGISPLYNWEEIFNRLDSYL